MFKNNNRLPYLNASLGNPLFHFKSALERATKQLDDHSRIYHFSGTFGIGAKDPYTLTCMTLQDYFGEQHAYLPRDIPNASYIKPHSLKDFMPVDGGTSRAFHMILDHLSKDVRDWNQEIQSNSKRIKYDLPLIRPVILMPVPTYGHFLELAEKNKDLEVVKIPRNPNQNWVVSPEILKATIIDLYKQGKRVVAYFDSNPNNPTGSVRNEEQTRELAEVFRDISKAYEHEDRRIQTEAYEKTNKSYYFRESASSRIRVIDDVVYTGLEYKGAPKAFPFCKIPEMRKDVFTLVGPSKTGLAGMRAGLIIADYKDIYDLQKTERLEGYCPSVMTMSLLTSVYNSAADQTKDRVSYQKRASTYYQYASLLTKALINGLPDMHETISKSIKSRMIKDICRTKKCSNETAENMLIQGIDGVRVITSPQSGFFHLVDFSQLIGRHYDDGHHAGDKARIFTDELDIGRLQAKFNFAMAAGGYTGMDIKQCLARITFAQKPADIIDMVDRIRGMAELTYSREIKSCGVAPISNQNNSSAEISPPSLAV